MKLSLGNKVVATTTALVVIFWVLALADLNRNYNNTIESAQKDSVTKAQVFSEYATSSIKRIDEIILDIRSNWNKDWHQFSNHIQSKQENIKDISFQIAVIDKDGLLAFSNLAPASNKTDLSEREHFKVHRDFPNRDALFISRPLIGKVSKKWSIQFTRPIFLNGKFNGVLVASVPPEHFGEFGENLNVRSNDVISVIRHTGERMARYPIDQASYGQNIVSAPFLSNDSPIYGNFTTVSKFDGIERIYGYYKLPQFGITTLVGESTANVLAPYKNYRIKMFWIVSFITLMIILTAYAIYKNLADRKKNQEAMQIASMVYENTSEAIMITDENGRIFSVNPAFTEITGYSPMEILGKTPHILSSGIHDENFWINFWGDLKTKGEWRGEIKNRKKNGEIYHEELIINAINSKDLNHQFYVAIFHDITDLKNKEEVIWKQANFDFLTNLPNRHLFNEKLKQEIKRSQRKNCLLGLIFLDLDHFKDTNDTLGHEAGDELLKEVGRRIKNSIREIDTAARMGGDEFTIILTDLQKPSDVISVSEKILNAISNPVHINNEIIYVTASLGIAIYPTDCTDQSILISNADQAMFASKENGRNRYTFFSKIMQERASARARLTNELHQALKNQEFDVYYQPIVNLQTGEIDKAEALIRWHHPSQGLLGPDNFVPLAESIGLINQMDDWLLSRVAETLRNWRNSINPRLQININKSAIEFRNGKNVCATLVNALSKNNLTPDSIAIEITESVMMEDSQNIKDQIKILRDTGFELALDDFGTGFSSLAYLTKISVNYLKIDQAFVSRITAFDSKDAMLCKAIIAIANHLNIKVIAEGVETKLQRDWLKEIGCDFAQGYFYSQPLGENDFFNLLNNFNKNI